VENPTYGRLHVNAIELAYFEWGSAHQGRSDTLVLAHATGFHARCWDQVIRHLPNRHVIALDQRGHGRSGKTEISHWEVFGQDLAAFVSELGLRNVVGVGHSMGGHAMVDAAALCPNRFRRLTLIDPVIAAPDEYPEGRTNRELRNEDHPTTRRKRHFSSPEEMFERFKDRVPYSAFDREVLRDYCEHGLLPAEGGRGFNLACPPEIESSIYITSRTNQGVHDSIRALRIPVLLLRAKEKPADRSAMDFSSSPTWPALVREFPNGREIHFAERTHFFPMETPKDVAALVLGEEVDTHEATE
jgi:pimeloyl-ACP methyl ester carboxylesterase